MLDLTLAEASAAPTTLEVANRLFPDDGFTMRPEFMRSAVGVKRRPRSGRSTPS